MPKAVVLFDVDGTLLITGGATSRAIRATLVTLFGEAVRSRGITAGRLDHEIFCDLALQCGVADPSPYLDRYKPLYLNALRRELAAHPDDVRLMPGVREAIQGLVPRRDVIVGLLTGNFREGVEAKFAAAHLDMGLFAVGAFAEDGKCRSDLVHAAVSQVVARTGEPCSPAQVILIGDTPRDVECARQAGCRVLAVATGRYTLEELLACGPDAAVKDLTEIARLDELIRQVTDG